MNTSGNDNEILTEASILPCDASCLTPAFQIDENDLQVIGKQTKTEMVEKFQIGTNNSSGTEVRQVIARGVVTKGKEDPGSVFTSHWAIRDKQTGKPIGIEFHFADPKGFEIVHSKEAGRTRFSSKQIVAVGEMLIRNFGNYHRLFWNQQHFAHCLLDLICDGNNC